ncbi:pSP1 domain protein [Clostridium sp. CAG:1193]|nr:pSP1 domain protein [Clostridium sp. CAG:1193]
MAKNQNLSLNPSKINGSCGRLLCCLTYENEVYEEYRKDLPNLGEKVKYEEKEGKVVELDILNKKYTIKTSDEEYIVVDKNESIK